ncbi:MAG: glucose-1-phosphate thymidylyltransferase RfbA [Paracoccaceae bacterium]|jgi:glucose-1-phosphate thymidylyltransferase
MSRRKGIILAGGSGTRLFPITLGISKQLLPVYDKPMIYYPLSVLMLTSIRDIAIITNPLDVASFQRMLGDGSQWGIRINYIEQPSPDGLAQSFILAEDFLDGSPSALILGDNIFHGAQLSELLSLADKNVHGAKVFGYQVSDPERYGVLNFDQKGKITDIIEKPEKPQSNYAVTGLYFVDATASEKAKSVEPSSRGELEIVTLLKMYLDADELEVSKMGRGFAWFDTGTHDSLLDASNYICTLERRQGFKIACLEEIAYSLGWIGRADLEKRAQLMSKNEYGRYLQKLIF